MRDILFSWQCTCQLKIIRKKIKNQTNSVKKRTLLWKGKKNTETIIGKCALVNILVLYSSQNWLQICPIQNAAGSVLSLWASMSVSGISVSVNLCCTTAFCCLTWVLRSSDINCYETPMDQSWLQSFSEWQPNVWSNAQHKSE